MRVTQLLLVVATTAATLVAGSAYCCCMRAVDSQCVGENFFGKKYNSDGCDSYCDTIDCDPAMNCGM